MKACRMSVWVLIFLIAAAGNVCGGEKGKSLFVNLTSNEMNRAAMAINFATRVRIQQQIPVTIFLNVDGVRLVDRNIPGSTHVNGKSLQEMLKEFMAAGGQVIACPMCMKNVGGMTNADLIDGVKIGSSKVTWPALFADSTTVLNY